MSDPGDPAVLGSTVSADERQWALFAHLGGLLATTVSASSAGFLAPLVIWLMKKDQAPFVDDQAKEALNFQISILIAGIVLTVVGGVLALLTFGIALFAVIPAGIALAIYAVVMPIVAAVKANAGDLYRYPLTLRPVK
ncbi:MAG: DUF4870 domain-containing protein [Planctomycetaceae bacterium]|nr:DUF4870 domain-containing protein [Planctomycetaceae bacterium]